MKKLIFLSMFVMAIFVETQAQVNYTLTNNSSVSWFFQVDDGANIENITVPSAATANGGWNPMSMPLDWRAVQGANTCALGVMGLTAPSAAKQYFCTGGGSLTIQAVAGTPPHIYVTFDN